VPQPPKERLDLLQSHGFRPGEAQALLEAGKKPSASVQAPKGGSVTLSDLFWLPLPGRKVVLLGDTCDSRAIVGGPFPLVLSPSLVCTVQYTRL